jgi:hypothetical protein
MIENRRNFGRGAQVWTDETVVGDASALESSAFPTETWRTDLKSPPSNMYLNTWFDTAKTGRIRGRVIYDLQPLSKHPFDTECRIYGSAVFGSVLSNAWRVALQFASSACFASVAACNVLRLIPCSLATSVRESMFVQALSQDAFPGGTTL